MHRKTNEKEKILTVDEDLCRSLELLMLAKGSVPNCASVDIAVVILGGNDRENRLSRFILVDPWVVAGLDRLRLALRVPEDLRGRRTTQRSTGQVQGPTFGGSRRCRRNGWI